MGEEIGVDSIAIRDDDDLASVRLVDLAPDGDPFDLELQRSQLRYVVTSDAAARSLAENYVGLENV